MKELEYEEQSFIELLKTDKHILKIISVNPLY